MAYLDIDFTIPIALLAGAIVAVLLVRQFTQYGERRAKERTRALIERHGARATRPPEGISEEDRAS